VHGRNAQRALEGAVQALVAIGAIGKTSLKLQFLEKCESGVLGGMLCLLGLLIMIFEH
jgi:hypothetical protein